MAATVSPLFTWRTAIARSDLRSTAKLVAFALSLFMSEAGDSCFPSHATLASHTSLSVSAVKQATKTLGEEGWLTKQPGQGRGRSTRYTATTPAQKGQEETLSEKGHENAKRGTSASEKGHHVATTTSKTTSKDHDRPRAGARERERNPLFDALALACELRLDAMTKESARLCGIAASEIAGAGGVPEMMRPAVSNYRRRYQGAAVTPKAIANHWPEIVPATRGARQTACDECGVGGGRHLADCSLARPSEDATTLAPR